jgi:hypothetical protein
MPRRPAGSSSDRYALKAIPTEVVTDAAPVYPAVLEELLPEAWHHVERYANRRMEARAGGQGSSIRRSVRLMTPGAGSATMTLTRGSRFVSRCRPEN